MSRWKLNRYDILERRGNALKRAMLSVMGFDNSRVFKILSNELRFKESKTSHNISNTIMA